jgi:hypothetical protein
MSIVSLVIAPTLAQIAGTGHGHAAQLKEPAAKIVQVAVDNQLSAVDSK